MRSIYRNLIHPRDELTQVMARIYQFQMTTTSGGNLSIKDENGDLWITPSRVDKGSLTRNDIIKILADGTHEGLHPASSELPFHQQIYDIRPDIKAIVHAHPSALVAFSICGETPDTTVFTKAHAVCGQVGFAPYALPGSQELGKKIANIFAEGYSCVMLENHGVVVGGSSMAEAFERFETLEFTAKTILNAMRLGKVVALKPESLERIEGEVTPPSTFSRNPPTIHEKKVRRELCQFIRRGYRQRLFISTEGSFSARVEGNQFLINPNHSDRSDLDIDELVLIDDEGRSEEGKRPSFATRLHRMIYLQFPEVQAVLNASPPYATAFSLTHSPLNSRTIPESYLVLKDVHSVAIDQIYNDFAKLVETIRPKSPVGLVDNDGAIILATSMLEAFDRLEVLEATSQAIIESQPLGAPKMMSHDKLEELEAAFG